MKCFTNALLGYIIILGNESEEIPSHHGILNQTSNLGIHNTYPCNTRKMPLLYVVSTLGGLPYGIINPWA